MAEERKTTRIQDMQTNKGKHLRKWEFLYLRVGKLDELLALIWFASTLLVAALRLQLYKSWPPKSQTPGTSTRDMYSSSVMHTRLYCMSP